MSDTKAKLTRTVKPVFAVMSIGDGAGGALAVSRDDVTIHGVYKNAEELLGVMDDGGLPKGAFYKQIKLA